FFLKQKAPARLMRLRDKLTALAQFGIDYVFCVPFNAAFAQQSAEQFIQHYLIEKLRVKFLSVGDDFRFGINRSGNFATLQKAGKQYGFQVENNASYCLAQQRVSSTAIREALAQDKLEQVEQMLGRPYSILGRVVHGNELGRTIRSDDFRFGINRSGNFATLQKAGKQYGFQVENNASYCLAQQRVSSTAIREALAQDKLEQVEQMLGRPYSILGRVVHGNELGRTI